MYLMRQRSEIPSIYQTFTDMILTQFNAKIKTFRADCASEYISNTMRSILQSHGTLFQQSCPYTHEQNGVAERKHRHVLETAHALLLSSSVLCIFWAAAVLTSVNLIDITPSPVLANKTPHERLYSSPPDYSMLRTSGCTCYVLRPLTERTKLSARSAKCVLLGISSEHKGYCCYDPLTCHLLISRHVSFVEDSLFSPSS